MTAIRYCGHPQLSTGYGQAALQLIKALDRAGVTVEVRTIGPADQDTIPPLPPDLFEPIITGPDAVIVHTLPGDCHRVLQLEGLTRGEGPRLIAYTTWEALNAPPEVLAVLYSHFDQVWVPSQVNSTAFHWDGRRPEVVPHCFDDSAEVVAPRTTDGSRFRFYWIGAWSARKNPNGLIRAFALAFDANAPVELVMHSPGCSMDTFVHALASTGLDQSRLPIITLSNKQLPNTSIAKLHAEADCFVTASRGEAWNLPAFEAMLAGRPVIAQYGLGSDDFLLNTNADLVDGIESPAFVDVTITQSSTGSVSMKRVGAQGLTSRCLWLEPNLSSLADAMRHAFDTRKRDINIGYNVAERFGYTTIANHVLRLLERP